METEHSTPRRREFGTGAFFISLLVHGLFILAAIFVFFKWIKPPPVPPLDFVSGGGGGGSGGETVHKVQTAAHRMMPSSESRRVAIEGSTDFTIPETTSEMQSVALPPIADPGKGSGGGVQGGNGRGIGPGIGDGIGPGGGGGIGKAFIAFGLAKGDSNRLSGYIYDYTQTKDLKPTPFAASYNTQDNLPWMRPQVSNFIEHGWNLVSLEKYFRGPNHLYLHQFLIPQSIDSTAPTAFGAEGKMKGSAWIAVYSGKVKPPESGEIRFCGNADNYLVVRLNKKNILKFDCGDPPSPTEVVPGMRTQAAIGTWVKVDKNAWYDMSVLIGDAGGLFSAALYYERKGQEGKKVLFRTEATDNKAIFDLDKGDLPRDLDPNSPVWGCKSSDDPF